jgi:serine/threonine protein kinase
MLERIGKYEIKRVLGKGATGTVYLATDPFRQSEVALKVMEKLPSNADEARRALRFFQNEAALAGKLRHPHIVSIFDAGIEEISGGESLRYLVMEVVNGGALTRYCEPGELLDPAARRSSSPTASASCIATSSRRTSWCATTTTSRSRTSAPRSSRAATSRRSRGWARPPTCRPSR